MPDAGPFRPRAEHELELDGDLGRLRVRVEHGDGHVGGHGRPAVARDRGLEHRAPRVELRAAVQGERILLGRPDARAGQDVVEVVEEVLSPRIVERGFGVAGIAAPPGHRAERLGLEHAAERRGAAALDARERGVAAREDALEPAADERSVGACGRERLVEPLGGAVEKPNARLGGREPRDQGEVRARGAAAVVADAPEDRHVAAEPERHLGARLEALLQVVVLGVVEAHGDPEPENRRAAGALPPVEVGGQRELGLLRPHVNVHGISRGREDLRQAGAVSEGIEVVGDDGRDAERLPEEAPALGNLADDRLGARQVDVGLNVPAAGDVPASGADEPADLLEERRVELADPAIENRLVVVEDELGVRVEELDRGSEGGERLGAPFLPAPLPDGVEVGVCDQVNARPLHGSSPRGARGGGARRAERRPRSAAPAIVGAPSVGVKGDVRQVRTAAQVGIMRL